MTKNKRLFIDLSILAFSIIGTILLSKFHVFAWFEAAVPNDLILAFVAGIFFVSAFTVLPASAMLINLVPENPAWLIALVAGLGSVLGDLVIFSFVKDYLASSLFQAIKFKGSRWRKWRQSKVVKIALAVVGAAIIASPLPDELGISLMGASSMQKRYFIPIAFILNTLGVYLLLIASLALR